MDYKTSNKKSQQVKQQAKNQVQKKAEQRIKNPLPKQTQKTFLDGRFWMVISGLFILTIIAYFGYAYFAEPWSPAIRARISNVTGRSATISWVTKDATKGVVVYGEADSFLPSVFAAAGKDMAYDDRDMTKARLEAAETAQENIAEIDGVEVNYEEVAEEIVVDKAGSYFVHHVTIKNLQPDTEYYFMIGNGVRLERVEIGEGDGGTGDNSIVTYKELDDIPVPNPAYGLIKEWGSDGSVSEGIMYLTLVDVVTEWKSNLISAVLSENGSWYVDLSNARSDEGILYFSMDSKMFSGDFNEELEIECASNGRFSKTIGSEEDAPATVIIIGEPDVEENGSGLKYEGNSLKDEGVNSMVSYVWANDCDDTGGSKPCSRCVGTSSYPDCEMGITYGAGGEEWGPGYMGYCRDKHCPAGVEPIDDCECACTGDKPGCPQGKKCQDHKCVNESAPVGQEPAPIVPGPGSSGGGETKFIAACKNRVPVGDGEIENAIDGKCACFNTNMCRCPNDDGVFDENGDLIGPGESCGGGDGGGTVTKSCCCTNTDVPTAEAGGISGVIAISCETNDTSPTCDLPGSYHSSARDWKADFDGSCLQETTVYLCPDGKIIEDKEACSTVTSLPLETGDIKTDPAGEPCTRCCDKSDQGNCICPDGKMCDKGDSECQSGYSCCIPTGSPLATNTSSDCCDPLVFKRLVGVGHCWADSEEDERSNIVPPGCATDTSDEFVRGGECECNRGVHNGFICWGGHWLQLMTADDQICEADKCICSSKQRAIGMKETCDSSKYPMLPRIDLGKLCCCGGGCWCAGSLGRSNRVLQEGDWCPDFQTNDCWGCTDNWSDSKNGGTPKVCKTNGVTCDCRDRKSILNRDCQCDGLKNEGDVCGACPTSSSNDRQIASVLGVSTQVMASESIFLSPDEGMFMFSDEGAYCTEYNNSEYCFEIIEPGMYSLYIDSNGNAVFDDGDVDIGADGVDLTLSKESVPRLWDIKAGFNFMSLDIVNEDMGNTASGILDFLNAEYDNAFYSIAKFESGRWVVVGNRDGEGYGADDFQVIPGRGYLLRSKRDVWLKLTGKVVVDPVPVSLKQGWNLIGIHGSSESYTAGSLIDSIDSVAGLDADNVTTWETIKAKYEGLQKEMDDDGTMQVYGFDFPIDDKVGYFVRVAEGSGTWTP